MGRGLSFLTTAGVCAALAACGGNPKPKAAAVPPPPAPATKAAPQPAPARQAIADPVLSLIDTSQRHFEDGERELKAG
ncbi:MAG: hypothetical protein HOQ29_07060, partial [Acidobacteria bacterium]|nr:hypothetical protein [Acidobacteriota bacterium]